MKRDRLDRDWRRETGEGEGENDPHRRSGTVTEGSAIDEPRQRGGRQRDLALVRKKRRKGAPGRRTTTPLRDHVGLER